MESLQVFFLHVKFIAFTSVYFTDLITSLDLCSREFYNTQQIPLSTSCHNVNFHRVSILMNRIRDLLHQYLEFVINGFENILEKTHFMILTVSIQRHPCHVCYLIFFTNTGWILIDSSEKKIVLIQSSHSCDCKNFLGTAVFYIIIMCICERLITTSQKIATVMGDKER